MYQQEGHEDFDLACEKKDAGRFRWKGSFIDSLNRIEKPFGLRATQGCMQ